MEIIESELNTLGFKIQVKNRSFGWIETLVAIKS